MKTSGTIFTIRLILSMSNIQSIRRDKIGIFRKDLTEQLNL